MPSAPRHPPDAEIALRAWSPAARALALAAQLFAFAVLGVVGVLALRDLLEGGGQIATRTVIAWVLLSAFLPLLIAALVRRFSLARARVTGDVLVLEQRGDRYEVPLASIAGIRPWRAPLPDAAATVTLRSGAHFERALSLPEVISLTGDALLAASRNARAGLAFATARQRWHRRGPVATFVKSVLFPVAIAAVVFRSYQVITYGGPLGEAHVFGWTRYLLGLAAFGLAGIAYLALIAFGLRALAELVCFGAAQLHPRAASAMRLSAEIAIRVLYYVAIPALLALRFFL